MLGRVLPAVPTLPTFVAIASDMVVVCSRGCVESQEFAEDGVTVCLRSTLVNGHKGITTPGQRKVLTSLPRPSFLPTRPRKAVTASCRQASGSTTKGKIANGHRLAVSECASIRKRSQVIATMSKSEQNLGTNFERPGCHQSTTETGVR